LGERRTTTAAKAATAGAKLPDPCLPEHTPNFVSSDPGADWARFGEALGSIVSVPKEAVDQAMEEAQRKRAAKRSK
jgi:hypothetical protein